LGAGEQPTAVHSLTRQVLVEAGIEVGALRAKGVNEFLGKASVQYAIVVCGATFPRPLGCATSLHGGFLSWLW
jgi:hypothetical protein